AGNGGGAGSAVGLEHIAVQHDGVLAQGRDVDDGAQRTADQAGDLVGAPADLALDRFAAGAGGGRAGQHGGLGGHPGQAGAPATLRPRGTPSVKEALHSTRVPPNSTRTLPSAWSAQPRWSFTGRSWSAVRPSARTAAVAFEAVCVMPRAYSP